MKPRAAIAAACVAIAVTSAARADYLEVRRPALLKRAAEREGPTIRPLEEGELVDLTGKEQENGYYQVTTRDGKRGFVYRTLVRRHRGALPSASPSEPRADEEGDATEPTAPPEEADSRPIDDPRHEGAHASASGELEPLSKSGVPRMRAHLINVGQGLATLFEFSCGAILVDTGGEMNGKFNGVDALEAYLEAFFDRRPDLDRTIDLLAITHAHIDHVRGAERVRTSYQVENVITNGFLKNPKGNYHSGGRQQEKLEQWARTHAKFEAIQTAAIPKGGKTSLVIDPLRCEDEDPRIRVLWGHQKQQPASWTDDSFYDANNHSVVIRIDFGAASFLMTGDLELDVVPDVVAKHEGSAALDVDVWQVSHHGSANGTGKPILDAVTPEIALLGTGDPNGDRSTHSAFGYGHPRSGVITKLLDQLSLSRRAVEVPVALGQRKFKNVQLNEAIFATGWDGSVVVTADSEGKYRIRTQH